jgi:hydrogenase maturation factor
MVGSRWDSLRLCRRFSGDNGEQCAWRSPGRSFEIYRTDGQKMAGIDLVGVKRQACLEYVPGAGIGDYVLVHVGFAISKVDGESVGRHGSLRQRGKVCGVRRSGERRGRVGGNEGNARGARRRTDRNNCPHWLTNC